MLTGDRHCGMLALARVWVSASVDALAVSASLITRMFRCTWFLATEICDAMVRERRQDELDALVAEARSFQESLRRDHAD